MTAVFVLRLSSVIPLGTFTVIVFGTEVGAQMTGNRQVIVRDTDQPFGNVDMVPVMVLLLMTVVVGQVAHPFVAVHDIWTFVAPVKSVSMKVDPSAGSGQLLLRSTVYVKVSQLYALVGQFLMTERSALPAA